MVLELDIFMRASLLGPKQVDCQILHRASVPGPPCGVRLYRWDPHNSKH